MNIENGILKIKENSNYICLRAGKGIPESIIYIPSGEMDFSIPSGEALSVYPKNAFKDILNSFYYRSASAEEISAYRNLALNPADKPNQNSYFPHAKANHVTRNSIWFESRNAIDGFAATSSHVGFPFQSWGGGDRDDLEFSLDFGRPVEIDKIVFYLRADYRTDDGKEHDTYWKDITIEFSDGTSLTVHPQKSGNAQSFSFQSRIITNIKLTNLVRDLSFPTRGFAALSQIEVWGRDII